MGGELTYDEVGATLGAELPPGYRHLRVHRSLGGRPLERAAEAVLTFAMHRGAGLRVTSSAPRAAVGVTVVSDVGPLPGLGPCRVVAVVDEPDRAGFAYGTLPGHLFVGEGAFVVERDPDGRTRLVVTSFTRPVHRAVRLAGPLVPVGQQVFARYLGHVLRRC